MKRFLTKQLMLCVLALASVGMNAQTQVIAHRGFWDKDGSAQNSVAALKFAAEEKFYGSEFDVQITSDSVLVVNHDDKIGSLSIADTPYSRLKDIRLKNGENLPTLDDYLKAKKQLPGIVLILEAKPQKSYEKENLMAEMIVKKVEQYQLQHEIEYISFSMNFCKKLKALSPETTVSYLRSDLAPSEVKDQGIDGIDYYYKVFELKPEWIEEGHQLGMKINAWTVNETDEMESLMKKGIDYITTDRPQEAAKSIQQIFK